MHRRRAARCADRAGQVTLDPDPSRQRGWPGRRSQVGEDPGRGRERQIGGPSALDRSARPDPALRRREGAARLDTGLVDRELAAAQSHDGLAGRPQPGAAAGRERDAPFAARRRDVPSLRAPDERAARASRHGNVRTAAQRTNERGHVQPLRARVHLRARLAAERQRAGGLDAAPEPVRGERVDDQQPSVEAPVPGGAPGPDTRERERGGGRVERPGDAVVHDVDVGARPDGTLEAAAGRQVLDERPVHRGAGRRGRADRLDPREPSADVDRGRPRGDPRALEREEPRLEPHVRLGGDPLDAQSRAGPAAGRIRHAQRHAAAPARHVEIEPAEHEPRRAASRPGSRDGPPRPASGRIARAPARAARRGLRPGSRAGSRPPVSRTTILGRRSVRCGPRVGDQSSVTRWTSTDSPGRVRVAAVATASPRHSARSSPPSRSVPAGRARPPALERGARGRAPRRRVHQDERQQGDDREGDSGHGEDTQRSPQPRASHQSTGSPRRCASASRPTASPS